MDITHRHHPQAEMLILRGRLDTNWCKLFEEKILFVLDKQPHLILLDFSEVDYISSGGLRVLLMAYKRLQQKKDVLILCNVHPHILNLFNISGFSDIFSFAESTDAALERYT